MKDLWLSSARALLQLGAGYLIGSGIVDADGANTGVGAVLTLITLGWSIMEKRQAAAKAAAAVEAAKAA